MARDKEAAQDIALYHMEKSNRNNPTTDKPKSLAEQLAELKKTPEQLRRESTWYDWSKDLKEFGDRIKTGGPGEKLTGYVMARHRDKIEEFWKSGARFQEVINYINSFAEELLNR